jgi:hypothetical protein
VSPGAPSSSPCTLSSSKTRPNPDHQLISTQREPIHHHLAAISHHGTRKSIEFSQRLAAEGKRRHSRQAAAGAHCPCRATAAAQSGRRPLGKHSKKWRRSVPTSSPRAAKRHALCCNQFRMPPPRAVVRDGRRRCAGQRRLPRRLRKLLGRAAYWLPGHRQDRGMVRPWTSTEWGTVQVPMFCGGEGVREHAHCW